MTSNNKHTKTMAGYNAELVSAKLATPELDKDILVQRVLEQYLTDDCKRLDAELAKIPTLLEQYDLQRFSTNEMLQRAILREGFEAVRDAVYKDTLNNAKAMGFLPLAQREWAVRNMEAIPQMLSVELKQVQSNIAGLVSDLEMVGIDLDRLLFRSGKLRVGPKVIEAIRPACTIEVTRDDRKATTRLREAVKAVREAMEYGLDFNLIRRMAEGAEYTDAELFAMRHGIPLTH